MLTNEQRRYLFSLAHDIKSTHQVGKEGITDQVSASIMAYLKAHELMKISVLKNCTSSMAEITDYLEGYSIETVRTIGRVMVLYKPNKKLKDHIVLPNK